MNQKSLPYLDKRRMALFSILFLFSAGVFLHFHYGFWWRDTSAHAFGPDEPFISYRYAKNWIEGKGLNWNAGERVEGYSDFLYVVISAVGILIHEDFVYPFCVLFNLILGILLMLWIYWDSVHRAKPPPWLCLLFLAITPSFWLWTASGFEPVFVCILLYGFHSIDSQWNENSITTKSLLNVSILTIACLLLRADGFLPVGIFVGLCLLKRRIRVAIFLSAISLLVLGSHILIRQIYYGWPLPNTYYAKVTGDLGARLLSGFQCLSEISIRSGFAITVVICFIQFIRTSIRFKKGCYLSRLSYGEFFCPLWMAYFIYVGGDVYAERILLPCIVFAGIFLIDIEESFSKRQLKSLVVVGVLSLLSVFYLDGRFYYQKKSYDCWTHLGKRLKIEFPDATLAVDGAGKLSYYSGLKTLDMLGLNESHIGHMAQQGPFVVGHAKFDPDYTLAKKPDLIATWLDPNLDARWGLTREKYQAAGYELMWVVYSDRKAPNPSLPAIIDVRHWSEKQMHDQLIKGYFYGVLSRRG